MSHPELLLPSASVLRRCAAIVYDAFILAAISMAYGALVLMLQVVFFDIGPGDYQPTVGGPLFQLGWLLSLAAFYFYFWRRSGQTIGMQAWRLKLVNRTGAIATSEQCLLRVLISPVTLLLFGLGYIWCLFDKRGDALQDILTKTRVVKLPKPSRQVSESPRPIQKGPTK